MGGGPNGAALCPDGQVYVCNSGGFLFMERHGLPWSTGAATSNYAGGSIQRADPETGAFETLYSSCDGQPLLGPNDLVFDAFGGFYFTDLGKVIDGRYAFGSLCYAMADGSDIRRIAHFQMWPNGCGLSPDGKTLYVAHSVLGWLVRWEVVAPGVIRSKSGDAMTGDLVGKALGQGSFDSLAVQADGAVCVATLGGGTTGAITVFHDDGRRTVIETDDPSTTNLCFGGADRKTAFITSGGRGRLLIANWPTPGLELS